MGGLSLFSGLWVLSHRLSPRASVRVGHRVSRRIDHFTVVCLVAWPLNEGEAGGDLALIETFLLFLC